MLRWILAWLELGPHSLINKEMMSVGQQRMAEHRGSSGFVAFSFANNTGPRLLRCFLLQFPTGPRLAHTIRFLVGAVTIQTNCR